MIEWTGGYVGDVEYLPGFFREQGPIHLDLACLIGGVQPPDRIDGLTYCELGCGQGLTVLLLAAANPSGHFVGIDFNPAHIARARALAAAAGLRNVELIEASFFELLEPGGPRLPAFDYVTLHGVYSWVSAENRRAVARFLAAHVRPGGLVYVSYNAMPGWMMGLPLQKLMVEFAGMNSGPSDEVAARAVSFVGAMQKAGARAIPDKEIVERLQGEIDKGKVAYVAHEYLNSGWQPLYHTDVARELADAKLSFVGSASLLENYPDLALTAEQRQLLAAVPNGVVREMLKDYFMARSFRRDVFVRGPRHLSNDHRERLLGEIPLSLIVPPGQTKLEIKVPVGDAKLEERLYRPALAALADRVLTPAQILDLPEVRGKTQGSAVELVGMLAGSGQAVPVPARESAVEAARAFNKAALRLAFEGNQSKTALAAPFAASGLHLELFDMLALDALAAGASAEVNSMADMAQRRLAARGGSLRRDGKPIENPAETPVLLREQFATAVAETVPIWRRLGVI